MLKVEKNFILILGVGKLKQKDLRDLPIVIRLSGRVFYYSIICHTM